MRESEQLRVLRVLRGFSFVPFGSHSDELRIKESGKGRILLHMWGQTACFSFADQLRY